MKTFLKLTAAFLLAICVGAALGAGVNGLFTTVNSINGYQVNGAAGTSGQALCSNGTYYNTPCSLASNGNYFTFTACNPEASSNLNNCTASGQALGVTYADTNYQLICQTYTTGGASTFLTVTNKTTSTFNYVNTVVEVNSTSSQ